MKPHILTRPRNEQVCSDLQAAGISPLLAQLYAARDIHSIDETSHDLTQLLHFRGLKHIHTAALQLAQAIDAGKRLLIIADYDADGATASKACACLVPKWTFWCPTALSTAMV